MEGASGSSRSPGSPGGVARGGGGSWKSRRDHLAEPGGALRWLGRSQGPPGRCWPGAGRAEPGLWAPGSRLPSGGLRAAQEAGGAAWGDGCPGPPGAGGQAARRRQRPPGALAEVLKGQLPAKAQPGRAASGRGQTGQDTPGAETPGREWPGSCGARTAPRAAGDSSLNPEHNFALAEPGGADPSYFRRWLPRAPRGPSALEERAAPPTPGYSSAPGASPSAAGGPRADRRRRAEEPDTGWGGRPRGLFVPGRGSGCTARCLGPFATVSSAPSPAPLGPHLPQSLRPGWVLGLGLCVGGRGALSGKPREPRGRLLAALVSAVDPESPAYLSPPIRAPVGAGSRPPSMLHCPFRTPGGGAGVRGHALSLPPPLAWSRMQKANEC